MNIYYKTGNASTAVLVCCSVCSMLIFNNTIIPLESTKEVESHTMSALLDKEITYCPKCSSKLRFSAVYKIPNT